MIDAYSIARQRADGHPGPDPKTNRRGSLGPRAFDDCLHFCLPGVPDLYNGRLLFLLERAAAEAAERRRGGRGGGRGAQAAVVAAAAVAAASPPSATAAEGVPGTLLARWNFRYGRGDFVQGVVPRLSLQLSRDGPPALLDCPPPVIGSDEVHAHRLHTACRLCAAAH